MAIEFKRVTIPFPSASGNEQTKSKKLSSFSARVVSAEAAIKGFNIGFSNSDHHLYRQKVDLDVNYKAIERDPIRAAQIDEKDVWVTAHFALCDASGAFDDPFDGEVEVFVIAETDDMTNVPYIRGTERVTFRAHQNEYVSAGAVNGYKLSATKSSPGDEERFTIEIVDNLKGGRLIDRSRIILVASNDKLVRAEGCGGRELIAYTGRDKIGSCETFTIRKVASDYEKYSDDGIAYGDRIALIASNGQIVCADYSARPPVPANSLLANRYRVAEWETFTIDKG